MTIKDIFKNMYHKDDSYEKKISYIVFVAQNVLIDIQYNATMAFMYSTTDKEKHIKVILVKIKQLQETLDSIAKL